MDEIGLDATMVIALTKLSISFSWTITALEIVRISVANLVEECLRAFMIGSIHSSVNIQLLVNHSATESPK
jgi:hypothetical protein